MHGNQTICGVYIGAWWSVPSGLVATRAECLTHRNGVAVRGACSVNAGSPSWPSPTPSRDELLISGPRSANCVFIGMHTAVGFVAPILGAKSSVLAH